MGNKGSTDTPGGLTASQQREENVYESYPPAVRPITSISRPSPSLPISASTPPPLPRTSDHRQQAHRLERRSMTVTGRERSRDREHVSRRLSTSDATLPSEVSPQQDTLQAHVMESRPRPGEEEVDLAVVICVTFDKDVQTVNVNKLFEVKCDLENIDAALKPVKGRCTFDSKTLKAELTPFNTLHPNVTYTVSLVGHAVTTAQSSSSGTISNAEFTFTTCNPPPKYIGIKMKGQQKEEVEKIQITNYYDLYNSLIVWSTRQWGCSGEHVTGLYVEGEERGNSRLQALKADQDILRLQENEIVVVEIKD